MAKSARDLCNKALEILMVAEPGQSIAAEDYQLVRKALDILLAELDADEVAYIYAHSSDDDQETIEDRHFRALAALLANDVASSFGVAAADEAGRQVMLTRLRKIDRVGPQGYVQTAEYF